MASAQPAQDGKAKQERIAALKQSLAQNQAALKQYTWIETTQVGLKGEVKKTEQKQCSYGPDGKVQKVPLAGAQAKKIVVAITNSGYRKIGG